MLTAVTWEVGWDRMGVILHNPTLGQIGAGKMLRWYTHEAGYAVISGEKVITFTVDEILDAKVLYDGTMIITISR